MSKFQIQKFIVRTDFQRTICTVDRLDNFQSVRIDTFSKDRGNHVVF